MVSDGILCLLEKHDWETTIPNLFLHAVGRLKGKTIPGNFTADDFVQESYIRVHDGKRIWDPVQNPNLPKYLESVIDSLISASIKSKFNNLSEIDLNIYDPPAADDIFGELICLELYDCIVQKIKDDEDLQMFFACVADYEITKPKEIAKELGWDISKVNNVKKRFNRIKLKIQAEYAI